MAEKEPVDLSQPENNMTSVADKIRNQLLAKNNFASQKNEYGSTNKDALSDGDEKGKGELDGKVGSLTDIKSRTDVVARNKYNPSKGYPDF